MTARAKKPKPLPPAAPVALTDAERELVARMSRRPGDVPRATLACEGKGTLRPGHANLDAGWAILRRAFGGASENAVQCIVGQLGNATHSGNELQIDRLNEAVAMVEGIGPRDTLEAMLASQMVAVHHALMRQARGLETADTIDRMTMREGAVNKLARTFSAQVETLKRYRSAGEQRMLVEHVHVHAGGQAVVGNVTGGRGALEKAEPTP